MRCRGFLAFGMTLAACGGTGQPPANQEVPAELEAVDLVTVGYDMADAGLRWMEMETAGADNQSLHEAFIREVAPTAGCKAIIRHWARFRDWDEEVVFGFVMEALGRKATDQPLVDGNGHPTLLGHGGAHGPGCR